MAKHVLVTGSSGHLGAALMFTLPSLGYTPIGVDILPSSTTTVIGPISDPELLNKLFTEYEFHAILHTATLHKPHIGSHTKSQFIDVNVNGTTLLLERAAAVSASRIKEGGSGMVFVFISSTTAFGNALSPARGNPAVWIDESVVCQPKNIYGVTKVCAEDICRLVQRESEKESGSGSGNGMAVIVLRVSRFFPEEDDVAERREGWDGENLKVNELCYRRVDLADIVSACVCAMEKGTQGVKGEEGGVKWGMYVISAPTPFSNDLATRRLLDSNPTEALRMVVPGFEEVFEGRRWRFLERVDRVYDSGKAERELGWRPVYTFQRAVEKVRAGEQWRSEVAVRVGRRGYHAVPTGVYTTGVVGHTGNSS